MTEKNRMISVYSCKKCDVEGSDIETETPVVCWNCGAEPSVTCRIRAVTPYSLATAQHFTEIFGGIV